MSKNQLEQAKHAVSNIDTIGQRYQLQGLECQAVTEASYAKQINLFLSEFGQQDLTQLKGAIQEFIQSERVSRGTKHIRKYALLKFFRTVLSDPLEKATAVEFISSIAIEKKATLALQEDQALSLEQVELVKKIKLTKKQKACFMVLVETGLRADEMLNIKLEKIKQSNHNEKVSTVEVVGKGNKLRTIYINNDIISMAKEAYQGKVYLFEGKNNNPLSYRTLYQTIVAVGERAGFAVTLHPHMLRHTFATLALKNGKKSIKAISTYLGHASTAITQDVYMHDGFTASDFE